MACLSIGESEVAVLAKESDVGRTNCYEILRTLAEKGAVTSVEKQGKIRYAAVSPRQLAKIFRSRLETFEEMLPKLESLKTSPDSPSVRFFTGKAGLAAIHSEAVSEAREICYFGSGKGWLDNFEDWLDFSHQLVRHRITIREVVDDTPKTREYEKLYRSGRQSLRFTNKGWKFPSDTAIWANKVAFLTYSDRNMHAVVVDSKAIAQSMRQAFELVWQASKAKN